MDPQQAITQISSLYANIGLQLWAIFGDLLIVVTGLVSCSLLIFGMQKIMILMRMAQTRYALSHLEMENSANIEHEPIDRLEMESGDPWDERKQEKVFSHY